MPLITVDFTTPDREAPVGKAAVAALVARLAASDLKKRPDLTAVVVRRVDAADWFVGGRPVAELGLATYAVAITVTEGTNTKAEKAAFLAALHDGMERLLGPLHPESYTHVVEARADAYGYAGLSQEFRFVAERMDAALRAASARQAVALHGVR